MGRLPPPESVTGFKFIGYWVLQIMSGDLG